MAAAPGKVIRQLRQALDMTQAELARASGWSASTISSWERGTTTPSRVAFKTLLAFAEERGVRYQPSADGPTSSATPKSGLPTLRLGSRLPASPVVARAPEREESFGSRRWTDVATHGPDVEVAPMVTVEARAAAFDARVAASEAARPDWSLDARLRVELGNGTSWLRWTAAFGAVLAALAIGAATGIALRGGTTATTRVSEVPRAEGAVHVAAHTAPVAPVQIDELALAAAPAFGAAPYADAAAAPREPEAIMPAMPASEHARLESIVALGGTRRATFRVGDRSIALVEGDQIGARTVALIANDEVALVGAGVATRVRLGFETPLD